MSQGVHFTWKVSCFIFSKSAQLLDYAALLYSCPVKCIKCTVLVAASYIHTSYTAIFKMSSHVMMHSSQVGLTAVSEITDSYSFISKK